MKTLVRILSSAVRRRPVIVIVVTVLVAMILGALSGNFTPSEDGNADFAPDAPELAAQTRISELFGADSSEAVFQIVLTAESGDVLNADGLRAVAAVRDAAFAGTFGSRLADRPDRPAVVSYLSPVEQSIASGDVPAQPDDATVDQAFLGAVEQLPEEQRGFVTGLLPSSADLGAASSPSGLIVLFVQGPPSNDEFEAFVDDTSLVADEMRAVELPAGFNAEPFSFELLFADQDEFQTEIGRLFATAGIIIVLVLSLVYLVMPRRGRNQLFMVIGAVLVLIAIVLLTLPSLALSYSFLPASIGEWDTGLLLGVAALVTALVFIVWSAISGRLRRTVADTLLTMVGIGFAISIMNGIGFLLYTDASGMTQILPILLIGLGVDYAIHITTRYREEMSEGATVEDSIGKAIGTVGVALVLATVATAVGFLTNVFNAIPALREFGVLAAVGIAASFLIMLTFLPAVRLLLDRRGVRRETLERGSLSAGEARLLPRMIGRTSGLARRAPAATLVGALLVGALGGIGVLQLEAKFSFLDFIPTTSPLRQTFETLLVDYGGGFGERTQVLIEGDVASADAWNAMLAANNNMSDTPNVVTFGGQPAAQSLIAIIAQMLNGDADTFQTAVAAAADEIGLGPDLSVPAGADLSGLYEAALVADPIALASVLRQEGGSFDAALFDITTQAGEAGAADLRLDLIDDLQVLRDAGFEATATSDEIISEVIVTTLSNSQLSSLLLTLVVVLVLLVLNFWYEGRRPLLGVITTIPVILVVLAAFGIMGGLGIPFGPITATVAALAVGIGIPYMIHITHRFEEDRTRFADAGEAIRSTLTHTGGALAGSALTTVTGFGILMTSTTIPFRQFGFVTAYTILLSLLAAILVLPSMLVLWDRWHRSRGETTEAVELPIPEKVTQS